MFGRVFFVSISFALLLFSGVIIDVFVGMVVIVVVAVAAEVVVIVVVVVELGFQKGAL